MEDNIKKGQEIELEIETLAFGGRGMDLRGHIFGESSLFYH